MKIGIFGVGWMGKQIAGGLGAWLMRGDIGNRPSVRVALETFNPDIVINAAGKTGTPNIDWCEEHKIETAYSNTAGPLILATECWERKIKLVHLSSGCLWDGRQGITEEDRPEPVSYYGVTKALADDALMGLGIDPLIVRLRMPFSGEVNPRNLITKLARYPKVTGAVNSITYTHDFITALKALIELEATGIYNIVNPGPVSHWEIMELYKEIVDPNHKFQKIEKSELLKMVNTGRSDCTLSTEKIEALEIHLPSATDRVKEALVEYRKSIDELTI